MVFTLFFFFFKGIYNATPPKRHVVLLVLQEDEVTNFTKRALHAGTVRSKWLKYALIGENGMNLLGILPIIQNTWP